MAKMIQIPNFIKIGPWFWTVNHFTYNRQTEIIPEYTFLDSGTL